MKKDNKKLTGTSAEIKLLEEKIKKLDVQRKSLNPGATMNQEELKILNDEANKKKVERILFVTGLIFSTVIMVIMVWPLLITGTSFFRFGDVSAAYNEGYYKYEEFYMFNGDDGLGGSAPSGTYTIVRTDDDEKDIIKVVRNETDEVVVGLLDDGTIINPEQIELLNEYFESTSYALTRVIQSDVDKYSYNLEITTQNKERKEFYENVMKASNVNLIADIINEDYSSLEFFTGEIAWYSNTTPFFAGFYPDDIGRSILYFVAGTVIILILVVLIVLYVILVSYGIRYLVAFIKGLTVGAKKIITDTGKNVSSAVLEEGANTSLKMSQANKKKNINKQNKKKKITSELNERFPLTKFEEVTEEDEVNEIDKVDILDDLDDEDLDKMLTGEKSVLDIIEENEQDDDSHTLI